MRTPAILGGRPAAAQEIPINQPTLPSLEELNAPLRSILESAQVTNGRFVRELEERAEEYCGVPHAIAVSNCTAGLMLALKVLEVRRPRVVLPSFTFPATAHIVDWNRLSPKFADCEESTFNLAPDSAERLLDDQVGALLAVPIFGNPVRGAALRRLAQRRRIPILYDAAHALGAMQQGKPVSQFADVAVYSLAPTKLVAAGEGGIITVHDEELARRLRVGRNYGNPGDYDCEFAGLNARMSEIHAAFAIAGLQKLEGAIARRTELVARYRERLQALPGIGFQEVLPGDRPTFNYFAMTVEPELFGLHVAELAVALKAENIGCRRYFYPPLHQQRIYVNRPETRGEVARTDRLVERVLCLPLFTHMTREQVDRVTETVHDIQQHAAAVRTALAAPVPRSVGVGR
jgi:dTDP-4-amino-4,6-dideoxygalactose transaminase